MSDAINRWQPNDFKDKVEKRIKETFVDLIPEEAFQKMVSDSIDNFTTGRTVTDKSGYGQNQTVKERYIPSGLERLVEDMLKDEVKTAIRALLNGDEWKTNYEGLVGDQLKSLVVAATPALITGAITQMTEQVIERVKNGY
jgi:hypothetical protein